MAKNMYQKRRERKEAKSNEVEKVTTTNINWDISTYAKPRSIPYEIRNI